MNGIKIISTGRGIPSKKVTNNDLAKIVDTNDEWITSRTGIKSRYYCGDNESNVDLAYEAAKIAIEKNNIDKSKIGVCVVATFAAKTKVPSIACNIQSMLELDEIPCFDINAACTGFVYAVEVAKHLTSKEKPYMLVVCSEQISRKMDFDDRGTCVLFGDGAGAIIAENSDNLYHSMIKAKGNKEILNCDKYIKMDGSGVFRFAVGIVPKIIKELLENADLSVDDVDQIICHQANQRILAHISKKMKVPMDKLYMNLQNYGNTSSASIPIALDEMLEKNMIKRGDKVMMIGFGGGLTWGGILLEY